MARSIRQSITPRQFSRRIWRSGRPSVRQGSASTAAPCPNRAPRSRQTAPPGRRSRSRKSPAADDPPEPILNVYVAEKAAANLVVATHRHPHPRPQRITERQISNHFFNSLLSLQGGTDYPRRCQRLPRIESSATTASIAVERLFVTREYDVCGLIEQRPYPPITAFGDAVCVVELT